jgi:hypothetical protein
MSADLIQVMCTYETLKNERTSNKSQAKTTGIENQNLLKTQTPTLTKKRKQLKENFIEQTNMR